MSRVVLRFRRRCLTIAALLPVLFAPQVLSAQYATSTVAGGGPNDLNALYASMGFSVSLAFDSLGNAYVANGTSNRVFKVNTSGKLTVVAGNGAAGYSGDGGPATSATLNNPAGVFVDSAGNIFIADADNCAIREVSAGNISTVAGTPGSCGYSGDGAAATNAQLNDPFGVFVDGSGNIFVADTDNCVIREVSGANIATVAGTPGSCGYAGDGGPATSAQLDLPQEVFVASGGIFIADSDNNLIRVVNPGASQIVVAGVAIPAGDIQTIAGSFYNSQGGTACGFANDGQITTTAQLCLPGGVFVDGSGNIFIADTDNLAIREVAASTTNILTTVAGTLGVAGYSADGTVATSADLNYPANAVVDGSGNIYIADTNNFVIREVTAANGQIQTTIGNHTPAYSGDGALAVDAELFTPGAVALDSAGNIYIADTSNSVIRVVNTGVAAVTIAGVTIQPGDIETVAGSYYVSAGLNPCDYSGDGAAATSAHLCNPGGVFVDASGNIYIADTFNNATRVVNPGAAAVTIAGVTIQPGNIATIAGNGTLCSTVPCGDGGVATSAELATPNSVFVDSAGNIFIADTSDFAIREVTTAGIISTVAGNYVQCMQSQSACGDAAAATSASLSFPSGVFVDASENIYIADTFDNRVRAVANPNAAGPVTIAGVAIAPGAIATVAGTGERGFGGDNGSPTAAQLDTPFAVSVDSAGNIFIADTDNAAIREVVASSGFIQTVAGIPLTPGFSGDGGQSGSAELNAPLGLFRDSAGNLFVADTDNQRIRKLVPSIFVWVAPNPINVAVSTQEQFTATVTATANTAVTWEVNGIVGGNSTLGTITADGIFTAPATIPTPATVSITAVSAADNTTSGSSQATIVGPGQAVNVVVSTNPIVTVIYTSTTQVFIATVTGTDNTAVTWRVNGIVGGNTTVGTIDAAGNYTAPAAVPTPNTVTIEAVSQAQTSAIGSNTITIVTAPSAAQPVPQTTTPGNSVTYSLLLNANTGIPGQPLTLSCSHATLPRGGSCSFTSSSGSPITSITPGAQAVAFSVTVSVPTGTAALRPPALAPRQLYLAFTVFMPLAGVLLIGAGRRNLWRNKHRSWMLLVGLFLLLFLLNACGGGGSTSTPPNPELGTYNIKVQGTAPAQPNPVTITIVGLTVSQ